MIPPIQWSRDCGSGWLYRKAWSITRKSPRGAAAAPADRGEYIHVQPPAQPVGVVGARLAGEKLFAVPFAVVRFDIPGHTVLFEVARTTLETAPGFDPTNWPELGNLDRGLLVRAY